jgi:rhamnosyltransferase
LKKNTEYPLPVIFNYLNQVYEPDITLFIQNKAVAFDKVIRVNNSILKKTAIHLHVYYIDILKKFISYFDNLNAANVNFDLYITTDTLDKKDIIRNYLKNYNFYSKIKEIVITEDYGGDILPWLSIKDRLNQYDIVGHFYTKKSIESEEWINITWLDDLLDALLYDINAILSEFSENDNLGIIIPEVPCVFRKSLLPDFSDNLREAVNNLWKKLKCTKIVDFKKVVSIITPVGNMFWYRTAALKPLLELQFSSEDIPREPSRRETVFRAIEQIHVYVAWNEGYDYKISLRSKTRDTNFIDIYRSHKIMHSLAYVIGSQLLALPKTIRRFLLNR